MKKSIDPVDNLPSQQSTAEQWILWYNAVKKKLGKDDAVNLFIDAWRQRGNDDSNTAELRAHMEKDGVKIGADWKDIVIDTITAPVEFLGGVFSFAKNLSIGTIIVVALFIIAILAAIVMFFFKSASNPKMVIETVAASATGGASLS